MNPPPLGALARVHDPEALLTAVSLAAPQVVLISALGPQTLVLGELIHRLGLPIPVATIDTGLLFPETIELRHRLQQRWGRPIEVLRPRASVDEQAAREGPALWTRDPARCCALRKVEPLAERLAGMTAWISGLRRDQSQTRAEVQTVAWDDVFGLWKVAPLAWWTREQVRTWLKNEGVPTHPLLEQGFGSVGCAPCTRPSSTERGGRWSGFTRIGCGLHGREELS